MKLIEDYDVVKSGPHNLITHILGLWHWPEYAKCGNGDLELHTAGWSGNEDIIDALSKTAFLADVLAEVGTRRATLL